MLNINIIIFNNYIIFVLSILFNIHFVISTDGSSSILPEVLPIKNNLTNTQAQSESQRIQNQIRNIALQLDPNKNAEQQTEGYVTSSKPSSMYDSYHVDKTTSVMRDVEQPTERYPIPSAVQNIFHLDKGTTYMRVADQKVNPAAFNTNRDHCANCKCGVKTVKNFVDGNRIEVRNDFPWTALILYTNKFYCGGALINDRFVTTAGHCTSGLRIEDILIYIQDYTDVSNIVIRAVINVYRPVGFDPHTFDNDISLIKLSSSVDITAGMIRPICLPPNSRSFVGKTGNVTSWELAQTRGRLYFKLLTSAEVQLLSNRQCTKTQMKDLITQNMICAKAKSNSQNICSGDGGGPLIVSHKKRSSLAGIISWSLGCEKKTPVVAYTRVTKFIGWIKSLTEGACWCT